jgi:hypothetical protein
MAVIYSGARYLPLGTQTQPKMTAHDIICLHTMVGTLYGTNSMFAKDGYTGLESHFGVGGDWGDDSRHVLDGGIYQWQDPTYTADANYEGNWHVISIETGDNYPQSAADIKPWTTKQISSIVRLVVFLCKTYDIPAVLIPDTKPGRRGIAYHRQGVEHSDGIGSHPGFLVAGGERWSTVIGKECPGDARIAQLHSVVIPQVAAILNPPESDVPLTSTDAKLVATAVWAADVIPDDTDPANPTWRADSELRHVKQVGDDTKKVIDDTWLAIATLTSDLTTLQASVAEILARLPESTTP